MAEGVLALVVGPSGAGKDSLINAARAALAGDPRFHFPRRIVTRAAVAELEDHDTIPAEAFEAERRRGAYALDWQAHGLCYGIPVAIAAELAQGRVVVANVSRQVLPEAVRRYPRCLVLLVDAAPELRAARLAGRGRESAADIARRLGREGAALPAAIAPLVIDNSGALAEGVARFVTALRQLAD